MSEKDSLDLELPVKPEVQLSGIDGNAFMIIGVCVQSLKRAMSREGYSREAATDAATKLREAMLATEDYEDLLAIAIANFEVN
jgi:hypothetical protein